MISRSIFLSLLCLSLPAGAGNIFFGLERNNNLLTVINQGDSSAYYPEALQLLPDGRWEALAPVAAKSIELPALGKMELRWSLPEKKELIQSALPIMIRFFDQAGSGIGQISMFDQPPPASKPLTAAYVHDRLIIQPPQADQGIHATWLLWGQEEGIAALSGQPDFEHVQPPAQRIDWQPGTPPQSFVLGKGLPMAIFLHETDQGLEFQSVRGGEIRGREQRTAWLGQEQYFMIAALIAAIAAALIVLSDFYLNRHAFDKTTTP